MKQTKRKRDEAATTDGDVGAGHPAQSARTAQCAEPAAVAVAAEEQAVSQSSTESLAQHAAPGVPAQSQLYALAAQCTVRDGVSLRSALLDLVAVAKPVTIDVRSVERIDTAALQVLCAFARDRRAAGSAVIWLGSSESFCEAVSLLGLQAALGVPNEVMQGGAP